MYADSRSAINTMAQANDMAETIGSPFVGVVVDVYHLWWDPDLQAQIRRCGQIDKLFAFHVCDWRTPTEDLLLDRGLMGEGCIDIPQIRGWVEEAGFDGYNEWRSSRTATGRWSRSKFLGRIIEAYKSHS